ncbi:retinol dehydrogenase 14-like [Spodoptera frugiperda]|uniref:Retinol dehydrogenase 14-like n=2 Tax=Spodoptera frugiperda TaxID=7108 RepID=A0A5Q0TZL7_SPOFR|nr:retinol dehydrogenase 14-like [Spodoptera frugiperda]QGA73392.1 retinol dehydrogenase 14-like protein [Spodoptera frugiperda]
MVPSTVVYVAAVPISVIVALGLLRKWRSRKWASCVSNTCLRGKTFLITGANSGIGYETAKSLVRRKGRVIFACRDIAKAKEAIALIRKEQPLGGEMIPMQLDLSSFESIEKFVEIVKAGFHKIDVLINNAGVVVPLNQDLKTKEGFEIHFGVNHLGHFYLTNLLMDLLKRATPSRIVVVSSTLHERGNINFDDLNIRKEIEQAKKKGGSSRHNPGYSNSKLMNAYFARALACNLRNTGIDVNLVCPGFCATNLFRYSIKWYHYIFMAPILIAFMKTAKQGSETVVFCATDHSIEGKTGKFYRDCAEYNSKYNFDKDVETKLWNVSEELVKARKPL